MFWGLPVSGLPPTTLFHQGHSWHPVVNLIYNRLRAEGFLVTLSASVYYSSPCWPDLLSQISSFSLGWHELSWLQVWRHFPFWCGGTFGTGFKVPSQDFELKFTATEYFTPNVSSSIWSLETPIKIWATIYFSPYGCLNSFLITFWVHSILCRLQWLRCLWEYTPLSPGIYLDWVTPEHMAGAPTSPDPFWCSRYVLACPIHSTFTMHPYFRSDVQLVSIYHQVKVHKGWPTLALTQVCPAVRMTGSVGPCLG